jgi:hypothetical protein
MPLMLGSVYKVVYIAVLLVFAGNALRGLEGSSLERVPLLGVIVADLVLASVVVLTSFSEVIKRGGITIATAIWLVALVWFAWFYSGSPFIQHESHTLDAANAALENSHYKVASVVIFSLFLLWFLSFPLLDWRKHRPRIAR